MNCIRIGTVPTMLAAVFMGLIIGTSANAQSRLDLLLDRLEGEPENFQLLWEVAAVASDVGSYDEAISALERLLIYFPQDADVRIELGVMYYRLGAYDYAERQFSLAGTLEETLSPDQNERIEDFREPIASGKSGIRSQSEIAPQFSLIGNASGTPETGQGYAAGDLVQLGAPISLLNAGFSFSSTVAYEPDNARGDLYTFRVNGTVGRSLSTIEGRAPNNGSVNAEIEALIPLGTNFEGLGLRGSLGFESSGIFLGTVGSYQQGILSYGGVRMATAEGEFNVGARLRWDHGVSIAYGNGNQNESVGVPRRVIAIELDRIQRFSDNVSGDLKAYAGYQNGLDRPSLAIAGASIGLTFADRIYNGRLGVSRLGLMIDSTSASAPDPEIHPTIALNTTNLSLSVSQSYELSERSSFRMAGNFSKQFSNLPNAEVSGGSVTISLPFKF